LAVLAGGVADPARRDQALAIAKSLTTQQHERAYWLALLGDRETALSAMETYFARGSGSGPERLWLPAFDALRDDARFQRIMARIGIPFPPKEGTAR